MSKVMSDGINRNAVNKYISKGMSDNIVKQDKSKVINDIKSKLEDLKRQKKGLEEMAAIEREEANTMQDAKDQATIGQIHDVIKNLI